METWMLEELRRQAEDFARNGRKDAHNRKPIALSMRELRVRRARRRVRRSLLRYVRLREPWVLRPPERELWY
ncbi:MAG: hypothetical protein ACM3S1_15485 [Hyphomicrobiales bacterium]